MCVYCDKASGFLCIVKLTKYSKGFTFVSQFCHVKLKVYRNVILPVALYGRKDWSLTLRE